MTHICVNSNTGMTMVNSKIHKYNSQVGEDDVFMVNIRVDWLLPAFNVDE